MWHVLSSGLGTVDRDLRERVTLGTGKEVLSVLKTRMLVRIGVLENMWAPRGCGELQASCLRGSTFSLP